MANDFPSRQDWWAPPATGTPAPSPSSPMAGALPLPSSPVGTPAGIVAGAPSGGAGGFDPQQLMQLLPLIFAKNNGARAAFLEGWERARQQDEQRKRWEQQQGIQQQAIDLRAEDQRQRVTEAEREDQTRADAQRQTAYERVREQWAKRLGTIRNKEEFDNALNQGERVLDSKFPGLHQPGDLAMMAGQFQPDTGLLDRFITSALTRKDDAAVLAMLQSNPEALARAQASGVVVGDQVVREPVEVSTPNLTPERKVLSLREEARKLRAAGKTDEAAAKEAEADAITKDALSFDLGSKRQPQNSGSTGEADADTLAQLLVDGMIVPGTLSKRAGSFNATLAKANKMSLAQTGKPLNFNKLTLDYEAAKRFVGSMNSTQMVRFNALAGSVVNTIDEVRQLGEELKQGGVQLWNRAKRGTIMQVYGNTELSGTAARYMGAVNTLKEEFANLAQGGFAPTEAAWKLANEQINADFGVKDLNASLVEVQRLINYRISAFEDLSPRLVSGEAEPGEGEGERVRVQGPNGETGTVPKGTALPDGWKVIG